jgi:hypothetical protein
MKDIAGLTGRLQGRTASMMRSLTSKAALLVAAALAGSTVAGAARAEEGVFMKNLLGDLGVIDTEKEPINYRERAPLVVPPQYELPPPMAPAGVRNSACPDDPEVAKKRAAAAERLKPVPFPNDNQVSQGARMTRDELARGPRGSGRDAPGPREVYGDGRLSTWVDPDKLGGVKPEESDKKDKLAYGQEPERGSLLEPPTGYRMPASNAPLTRTKERVSTVNDKRPELDFKGE